MPTQKDSSLACAILSNFRTRMYSRGRIDLYFNTSEYCHASLHSGKAGSCKQLLNKGVFSSEMGKHMKTKCENAHLNITLSERLTNVWLWLIENTFCEWHARCGVSGMQCILLHWAVVRSKWMMRELFSIFLNSNVLHAASRLKQCDSTLVKIASRRQEPWEVFT